MVLNSESDVTQRFLDDFACFRESIMPYTYDGTQQPVRVAIIDTGVSKQNGGIAAISEQFNESTCYSWVGQPSDYEDIDGHGTSCASILNEVAPNAKIYVARAFSRNVFNMKEAENIPKVRHNSLQSSTKLTIHRQSVTQLMNGKST